MVLHGGPIATPEPISGFPAETFETNNWKALNNDIGFELYGEFIDDGHVDGFISDAHSGKMLKNVSLYVNDGSNYWTETTDSNGYYCLHIPVGNYNLNAVMENYVDGIINDISVINASTVSVNIALIGSVLTYSPTEIIETFQGFDVVTNTVTLTNSGPLDINFSIDYGKFNWPAENISAFYSKSISELAGVKCFGYNIDFSSLLSWDINSPNKLNVIDNSISNVYGGDFLFNDFTKLYAITSQKNLITINTSDGKINTIGPLNLRYGDIATDISQDPTDGTLYTCAVNSAPGSPLYIINPETGEATWIGNINNVVAAFAIAINSKGEMYVLNVTAITNAEEDKLVKVNKKTCEGSIIGSHGYNAHFLQGMDFNYQNDELYIAAFNADVILSELRICDVNTGNTTNLGSLGDGSENINTLAIAAGAKPNWINISTNTGYISSGNTTSFDVIFDANMVANYGTFSVDLTFSGSFINDLIPMPLTMIVNAPPAPAISINPLLLDLGQIEIGNITQSIFSVENIGTDLLSVDVAITNCSPTTDWLFANWDSANIATGDFDYLEVTADTTGFSEGTYTCDILFASNDPDNPEIYVPVSMEIIPEPFLFIIYFLTFIILALRMPGYYLKKY